MAPTLGDLKFKTSQIAKDIGYNMASEADYTEAVNEAQARLSGLLATFWGITTISCEAGVQSYPLPENYLKMPKYESRSPVIFKTEEDQKKGLQLASFDFIRSMDEEWFNTLGVPNYFWVDAEHNLNLYPIPEFDGDENIRIQFIAKAEELVLDEDESQFPGKWKYPICYMAAALLSADNELYEDAARYNQMAEVRIAEITSSSDELDNEAKTTSFGYIGG
jgi:hypothetical protein